MYSVANTLQNTALSLMEYVSGNLGQQVTGYIDPNTMQHVFTFLGPILAFFAAAASVIISAVFFLRHHLVSWLKKASGVKLVAISLVLVSIATSGIVVAYKLILYLTTH